MTMTMKNKGKERLMPLPELAQERPTMPLTSGVYIGGRNYWTVATLVLLLEDGLGRMTVADLERIIKLGDDAYLALKDRDDAKDNKS